ncbi:MAG: hypothetical protein O2805_04540 [Proteobacteria bacterium]|nr:hypothetical protein [Pseudomonadota bacterium]
MKKSIKSPGFLLALLFLCGAPPTFAAPLAGQVMQLAGDAGDWLRAQAQV